MPPYYIQYKLTDVKKHVLKQFTNINTIAWGHYTGEPVSCVHTNKICLGSVDHGLEVYTESLNLLVPTIT